MGACTFATIGYGKTAQEAYDKACREAEYEYGHSQYNGTISTTSGFRITLSTQKMTDKHLAELIDRAFETTEKWGRCRAIELPYKYYKGKGRGIRAWMFAGWAAE
jgi:hypothetical protein